MTTSNSAISTSHLNKDLHGIPGFGESTQTLVEKGFNWKQVAKKTAKYAAILMIGIALGSVLGGGIGALIGVSIAGTLVISHLSAMKIWQIVCEPKMSPVLSSEVINAIPDKGPKLGTQTRADLRLCSHVTESFEWKKKLVETAEKSIEISPNFAGGKNFREWLQIIDQRMKEKPELKVHILCSEDLLEEEDKQYLASLSQNPQFHVLVTQVQFHYSDPSWSEENHVKLLIVDEKYFVMGGSGMNEVQVREITPEDYTPASLVNKFIMPSSFRDADIVGKGEIVQRMRIEFFKLYTVWEQRTTGIKQKQWRYFPIEGKKGINLEFEQPEGLFKRVKVQFFVGGPEHRKNNPITHALVKLIHSATKSIQIANSQFNPDKKILKALKQQKCNVTISAILNKSVQKFMLVYPSRANYKYLDKIYEYDKGPTVYHKKIIVVDNKQAIIGSYNFSQKSAHYDNEIALQINDKNVVNAIVKDLKEDLSSSEEYIYPKDGLILKIQTIVGYLLGHFIYNFT
jgi:phosphatidylserine/phosphatidylglycerophosphate/cardiolipin synthase-like enzyme